MDFKDYINELNALDNQETRTELQTFYTLHASTFKFFKAIDNSIQELLNQPNISKIAIEQIENVLPVLTKLKREISKLDPTTFANEYKNEIQNNVIYIQDTMTLSEIEDTIQEFHQRLNLNEEASKKNKKNIVKATAVITSVRVDQNVAIGDESGLRISINFQANYMENKNGQVVAYFYLLKNNNLSKLMDCNQNYCCSNGQVCIKLDFVPTLPLQQYNNFSLFIPYDELHLPQGKHSLNFNIEIFDNLNASIASVSDYHFDVDMKKASSLGVHNDNETSWTVDLWILFFLLLIILSGVILKCLT